MKIKNPYLIRTICVLGAWTMKALFRTCRIVIHCEEPDKTPYNTGGDEQYTFCLWHDSILFTIFVRNPPPLVALVGPHRDGGFVAGILKAVKQSAVRGSSSKGGAQAVLKIAQESEGKCISISPDGPRGPKRQMKSGCAFISAQTGKPVMPLTFGCSNAWRIPGSWSELIIPKPFSKIYAVVGRPFEIPKDSSREEIDAATQHIQNEMDRLTAMAEALAEGQEVDLTPQDFQKIHRLAA